MRSSSLAVLVLLVGCAAEISGIDGEPIAEEVGDDGAPLEASAQALAASTVPVMLSLGDTTIDGVDDRAYTRHGFVFRSSLRTTRANGIVENHANAS
ncbi:MAG TPA: hypothetical protein VK524_33510, partial [Polyangiaceae bacterium]|nr:hypothetical protein [Polyangiaceae bacterium]